MSSMTRAAAAPSSSSARDETARRCFPSAAAAVAAASLLESIPPSEIWGSLSGRLEGAGLSLSTRSSLFTSCLRRSTHHNQGHGPVSQLSGDWAICW